MLRIGPLRKAAHPRSRGENRLRSLRGSLLRGSSPLTRGKPRRPRSASSSSRLIPAHAGKTHRRRSDVPHRRAHPRSRGENTCAAGRVGTSRGSSPLTRGKPDRRAGGLAGGRLIPAHAGKTARTSASHAAPRAHPRSRGENLTLEDLVWLRSGSSPLTRGKHFPTCAFTAQIDQILETLELAVSSGSYSVWVACATDAPQDQVRSIGLVLPSSRGAS